MTAPTDTRGYPLPPWAEHPEPFRPTPEALEAWLDGLPVDQRVAYLAAWQTSHDEAQRLASERLVKLVDLAYTSQTVATGHIVRAYANALPLEPAVAPDLAADLKHAIAAVRAAPYAPHPEVIGPAEARRRGIGLDAPEVVDRGRC